PELATADVQIDAPELLLALSGPGGAHLRVLEAELDVVAGLRGDTIRLSGKRADVSVAERALSDLLALVERGRDLDERDVRRAARTLRAHPDASLRDIESDVVLGIGPAGTGKTYLAMAMGVRALQEKRVRRIILTRPAVEAGEKLGFLPGDLAEKVNPYLRPLYDAMNDMMDIDKAQGLIERGQIEVAPLAFMRGRTLNDSFVILDEAQNATVEQMKMFLTRLGFDSKAVITGDVTQVDLPEGRSSGLAEARALLTGVEGISFCEFTDVDVVRHPLVQKIIVAYEARDARDKERRQERQGERAGRETT